MPWYDNPDRPVSSATNKRPNVVPIDVPGTSAGSDLAPVEDLAPQGVPGGEATTVLSGPADTTWPPGGWVWSRDWAKLVGLGVAAWLLWGAWKRRAR